MYMPKGTRKALEESHYNYIPEIWSKPGYLGSICLLKAVLDIVSMTHADLLCSLS